MRYKSGFTYIELIIYIGVFVVISGIFTSVITIVTRSHTRQLTENELNSQLNLAIQTIQRYVSSPNTAATIVNSDGNQETDASPGNMLVLRRLAQSEDPTKIYIKSSFTFPSGVVAPALVIQKGAGAEETLTTDKVRANSIAFTKFNNAPSLDSVGISLALEYNVAAPNNIIRDTVATVGRASAATFDTSVYPNNSNSNVGLLGNPWKDGFFSGVLRVDGGVRINTPAGALPSCSGTGPANAYMLWLERGATGASPTSDKLWICAKNGTPHSTVNDNFSWRQIGF